MNEGGEGGEAEDAELAQVNPIQARRGVTGTR